ncbi:MAG: hypothetical protein WCJ29_01960 [bacterium]
MNLGICLGCVVALVMSGMHLHRGQQFGYALAGIAIWVLLGEGFEIIQKNLEDERGDE